jgi:hypothetical protein
MRSWWIGACALALAGCQLAQLPDAVFACEDDGTCAQPGFVCGSDGLCRAPTDAGAVDAGVDAGVEDAGVEDAGFDAGVEDAGFDAGFDAGVDAGIDAGPEDAGVDAGVDAGCVPTGAVDEPDQLGLDVNCDGFDGDLSRAIFVATSGNDANAGTQQAPVLTLTHALTLGREQVYVATGTYAEDVALGFAGAIYGGYDGTTWSRSSTKSIITGVVVATPSDAGRVVLERLEVQAPVATGAGAASIAVTLRDAASTSRIEDCRFVGGTGALGSDGFDGAMGAPGRAGSEGISGAQGGDGGLGGAPADCGDAGFSLAGFAGGSSLVSGVGEAGGDATVGGAGAAETVCDGGIPCDGIDGGFGLAGNTGLSSNARPADPVMPYFGVLSIAGWQGASLGTWAPGQAGRPGGGGGAGGGLVDLGGGLLALGGGAGGGGSGGCGGQAGTSGQSGGASIALALVNASPTLVNVQLVTTLGGRGGNGGQGGAGGPGGTGGAGSLGATIAEGTAGSGAAGSRGGDGAAGRRGPGGWGGPVVGLFCAGTAAPVTDSTTTWMAGTPGVGGDGDPTGQAGAAPVSGYSVGCP